MLKKREFIINYAIKKCYYLNNIIVLNNDITLTENQIKKDIHIFFIIRKMFRFFIHKQKFNDRLILNNIIICLNIFGFRITNIIFNQICNKEELLILYSCFSFLKIGIHSKTNTQIDKILEKNDIKYNLSIF